MIAYIRTTHTPRDVQILLKYYLTLNKYSADNWVSFKTKKYIKENFNISTPYIINRFIQNIRVSRINPNVLSIYLLDEKIKDSSLKELISLIEYGNRELGASYAISKYINGVVQLVKSNLGGI